jgi:hypothetical protein
MNHYVHAVSTNRFKVFSRVSYYFIGNKIDYVTIAHERALITPLITVY